jgi:serine/threonine protein kinase
MKAKYSLKDDISENARNMIKGLLNRNPNTRFSPSDVLSHPWMQEIPE